MEGEVNNLIFHSQVCLELLFPKSYCNLLDLGKLEVIVCSPRGWMVFFRLFCFVFLTKPEFSDQILKNKPFFSVFSPSHYSPFPSLQHPQDTRTGTGALSLLPCLWLILHLLLVYRSSLWIQRIAESRDKLTLSPSSPGAPGGPWGPGSPCKEMQKKLQRRQTGSGNAKHWVDIDKPNNGLDFSVCAMCWRCLYHPGSPLCAQPLSTCSGLQHQQTNILQGPELMGFTGTSSARVWGQSRCCSSFRRELGLCTQLLLYPRHAVPFLAD